jgi:hypothetical protein
MSFNATVYIFIAGGRQRAAFSFSQLQCHPHFGSARDTFCIHAKDIVLVTTILSCVRQKALFSSTQRKKLMIKIFSICDFFLTRCFHATRVQRLPVKMKRVER